MTRFTALTAAIFMVLMPLTATAGPGGGGGPSIPPVFESGSPSGIVIQEAGGFLYGYNMAGLATTGEGALPPIPAGYTLVAGDKMGWPDLDGNGISDIVIQHTGGFQYAYLMQDSGTFVSVLSEGPIPALPAGYVVLGWPDLDGDGDTDLVIQEPSGFTFAYLMNGLTVDNSGAVPGLPSATYSTIGFPDLDGANGDDIVIQDAGGFTFAYLMNGLVESSSGQIPGLPTATYSTIGFPNLDGADGDDIVIQEAGGFTYAYLMNGLTTASEGPVPGLPTVTYTTIGFPNLDDANGADIVIQEAGGYTYAYLMNGLATASEGPVPGLPTVTYTTEPWAESWAVLP